MRFLLDANMPRSAGAAIRALGHECADVRDIGMGAAPDSQISEYARRHSWALISRDLDFADVRNYPPRQYHGLVVLELPDDAAAGFIVSVLASFLRQESLLAMLPGRLAIVQPGRVRLRPGA